MFLAKNNKEILLYLSLGNDFNTDSILKIKEEIINISKPYKFNDVLFFNSDLTRNTVINKLKKESIILTSISIALVILILSFFMRSFVGVLIPLSVVLICVIWILGTMSLLGVSLNVLSIAIPVIVGVISLSDVIHIVSRYNEEKETDKFKKIKLTQKDMLKAIVLTSITTSFGFLSLIPSQIKVFIEFGFFTTLGVFFAFILAYFLLPILLFYTNTLKVNNILLKTVPKKIYSKRVSVILFLVVIISIIGLLKLKSDSYIYDDINEQDKASKSIKMINEGFYGIRDVSLAISLKDTNQSILSFDVINKLSTVQNYADSLYDLNNCTSLVTLISQMNRAKNGGGIGYFIIPKSKKEYFKTVSFFDKNKQFFNVNQFISNDKKSTFIYAKTKDVGSYEINLKNKKLSNYIDNTFKGIFDVEITGGSHILDQTNFSITNTMFYSLLGIVVLILIIISFIFNSIKVGLISLLPNVFPLLIILTVIGWFGLGINISTSIVFTIVFGIAVDDTIHFLSRYKIEKELNTQIDKAIINTLKTSGGAISLTTIILLAGFGVLMFSQFSANFLTGMLVCIGLVTALLSDLFVLPLLLKVFDNKD
jgi:predicted RND superfamily exporter protein